MAGHPIQSEWKDKADTGVKLFIHASEWNAPRPQARQRTYSHSMVPGGLLVTSSTTRFTSGTSLVIRVEICSSTS